MLFNHQKLLISFINRKLSGNIKLKNGKDVAILTSFDEMFVTEICVYYAQVLSLASLHKDLKLISCGSYRCELFFGFLRMMSKFDNSV